MHKFVFILGRNPQLSRAEIAAVLPLAKFFNGGEQYVMADSGASFVGAQDGRGIAQDGRGVNISDCQQLMDRLGGTVKIGQQVGDVPTAEVIAELLASEHQSGKLNFGISYYGCKPQPKLGMETKRLLRERGIGARLVVGEQGRLTSVQVAKNKCHELLVVSGRQLFATCAVQDFAAYSNRDFGRPARDTKSGTMPPKLARIMVNLAQVPAGGTVLDPFCGSGTVLQEALLLGCNVIGSDNSARAVADTEKNIEWLTENFAIQILQFKIWQNDVAEIGGKVANRVDAVVTEPHLGPPLHGYESERQIEAIAAELTELYATALQQFRQVLVPDGRVVMVLPWFRKRNQRINLEPAIKKNGFHRLDAGDLVFQRPEQHVWREVAILR